MNTLVCSANIPFTALRYSSRYFPKAANEQEVSHRKQLTIRWLFFFLLFFDKYVLVFYVCIFVVLVVIFVICESPEMFFPFLLDTLFLMYKQVSPVLT